MCGIKLDNVSFSYPGEQLLTNINMTIASGEFVVILGPNGSGKSTLLKLMTGLLQPMQGSVTIEGIPVAEFRKTGRISYVPQNYNRSSSFPATVMEIVSLGAISRQLSLSKRTCRDIAEHMLTLVDARELGDCRLSELSGGQQQRVMVARALASDPGVLFLDEPTSGIDPRASAKLYELLHKLNGSLGVTVIMVSHDVDNACRWASRVACINYGLCYFGDSQEFLRTHKQKPHSWYYGA